MLEMQALINRLENAECHPDAIEVYVSDHGGETIMSTDFQQFLLSKGIFWQTAPRATPNYNSIVERSIQSKKAMMRTFHIQSQLSWGYWPLTSAAARMIMNRLPRASNPGRLTPYELYFGRKPDLSSLRVFGCLCYYWLPHVSRKGYQQSFLEFSTASRGIFVGYDEHRRAFRVLPEGANAYILARSVVFDERSTIQRMLKFCGHTTTDPEAVHPDAIPIQMLNQPVPTITDYIHPECKRDGSTSARAASPTDIYNRRNVLISAKNVQSTTPGTPTYQKAEAKRSMSTTRPAQHRSPYGLRPRHLQLLATDEELKEQTHIVVDEDEYFPPIYFDIPQIQHITDDDPLFVFLTSPGEINNDIPVSDEKSLHSPFSDQWRRAREEELNACNLNVVWGPPISLPPGKQAVNLGFVYALKQLPDSKVRYKARLVFKNHPFATASTWEEVFSPVVDKSTLRLFFTLVAEKKLHIRQGDVVTAYLNAPMTDEVYIKLPIICGDPTHSVRRLLKAIYGHPKAGQLWNDKFVSFMISMGFLQCSRDPCFFYNLSTNFLLVLYVDDLLAAAGTEKELKKFWISLSNAFKLRDMGQPKFFLGMEIHYIRNSGVITISQHDYITKLAAKFGIDDSSKPTTPIRTDYYKSLESSTNEPVILDFPYKELVGALIFVMVCTRPDISFAVNCLTQYFSSPKALHWETAIRCLSYLLSTSTLGIVFGLNHEPSLTAFSDSDWAGNPITRRSVGGHCIYFGKSLIMWSSKTQRGLLALSTTESEYIEMALTIRQLLYIQPTITEVGFPAITSSTILWGDNQPAISSVGNKSSKSRTKHIDVRLKFCGEVVKKGILQIKYISSSENIADIFTKPLPTARFRELRTQLVSDVSPIIELGDATTAKLLNIFTA